ncbi:hypothetical protein FRB90_003771, partial [Tulasnella sp. 427]
MQAERSGLGDERYVSSLNPEFGDARGFWNRYEELAGNIDRDLSKDLNANLDTLLIFAGLFSAINTAFISLAMPDLSPGPLDRTNSLLEILVSRNDNVTLLAVQPSVSTKWTPAPASVAANCLLYASLCCSLLAAAGAMLGKEWLQFFDRKGKVASLGDQARLRQKKFTGVQKWHFRETIQLLPYTLLLSVCLFFAGLVPYLLRIHSAVANVVIAFMVVGTVLWLITVLTCVLDPHSPYQNSLTYLFLRLFQQGDFLKTGIGRYGAGVVHSIDPNGPRSGYSDISQRLVRVLSVPWISSGQSGGNAARNTFGTGSGGIRGTRVTGRGPRNHGNNRLPRAETTLSPDTVSLSEKHVLNAETASWLLGITSKPEDVLIVAQNLCCLELDARSVILEDPASWKRLLYFALEALQRWRDQPGQETKLRAEFLGAALCRLLIHEPRDEEKWHEVRIQFQDKFFQSNSLGSRQQFLGVLKSVLIKKAQVWREDVEVAEYDLRKAFLQTQILEPGIPEWSAIVGAIRVQYDDVILNLLAVLISTRFGPDREVPNIQDLAIRAYSGYGLSSMIFCDVSSLTMCVNRENLVRNLSRALSAHNAAFDSTPEPERLDALYEIYTAFLQKVQDHFPVILGEMGSQSTDALQKPLCQFVLGLVRRRPVKQSSAVWLQSSMRAVIALQGFPVDEEICKAIGAAMKDIIAGVGQIPEDAEDIDQLDFRQFTHSVLSFFAPKFAEFALPSLGNDPSTIQQFVSAATSTDNQSWHAFFATHPMVWLPRTDEAISKWTSTNFAESILKDFKKASKPADQKHLAQIISHIASTKSHEWCKQLIANGLTQIVVQSIEGKSDDADTSIVIPVATALHPLLAVFKVHTTDWATDQMHKAIGKLSSSIADPSSVMIANLMNESSELDIIATLVEFIEQIRKRRMFEGADEEAVTNAVQRLIKRLVGFPAARNLSHLAFFKAAKYLISEQQT